MHDLPIPYEPKEAFDLFKKYLALPGKRSFTRLSEITGVSVKRIQKLANRYKWQERAKIYDEEMIEREREEYQHMVKETCLKHAKLAERLQRIILQPVEVLARRIENGELENMNIDILMSHAYNAMRLLKPLIEIERLAKGMSIDNES